MSRFLIVLTVAVALSTAAWAQARSARSFAHSVTSTAARVEPPTGDKSYVSIRCWQAGSTPVYLGGKDVSPKNGYAICTNTPAGERRSPRSDAGAPCQTDSISLDVSDLYAVVSPLPGALDSPSMQSLSCIIAQ